MTNENRILRIAPLNGVPTLSEWGLVVLTLVGLASGAILFGRRAILVKSQAEARA